MMRVLVVDDEPSILAMLQLVLEGEGYEVQTASNGHRALERLAAQRPDVVLSDIMMPELDGWALLRAMQDDAQYRAIPVLLMSAGGTPPGGDHQRGTAPSLLRKPFNLADLLAQLARLTDGGRAPDGDGAQRPYHPRT